MALYEFDYWRGVELLAVVTPPLPDKAACILDWQGPKLWKLLCQAAEDGLACEVLAPYSRDIISVDRFAERFLVPLVDRGRLERLQECLRLAGLNACKVEVKPIAPVRPAGKMEGKGIVKFQTGCPSRFGKVILSVEPHESHHDLSVQDSLPAPWRHGPPPELVPTYVDVMVRGALRGAKLGVEPGRPLIGARIDLLDGFHHPVDSCPRDFMLAAALAVQDALTTAGVR